MLDDVFHIVDGLIELVLIEASLAQLAVELGKMVLRVVVPLALLFIGRREPLRAPQVVLHAADKIAGPVVAAALGEGQSRGQCYQGCNDESSSGNGWHGPPIK